MRKQILAALLACILLLSGCRLAVPSAGPEADGKDIFSNSYLEQMNNGSPQQDRLAGVFITREYLNTEENPMSGESDSMRIYAEKAEAFYEFTGLEGVLLASFRMQSDPNDPDSSFWGSGGASGASDVRNHYKVTDVGSEIHIQACLYLPHDLGEIVFYFNPVYQTDAGDVYLLPGTGFGQNTVLGSSSNQTVQEKVSITENGAETIYSTTVDVATECIALPKSVTLIQMDAEHRVLTMDTYTPGLMPEEFTPRMDAAYILVEENYQENIITSVNTPGSDDISVFYRLENDLCIRDYTKVNWPSQP